MRELHLRDVIKSIKLINIFDDVKHSHYFNEDISKLNEDEDITQEDEYLFYSDESLSRLSQDILHSFTNVELLDRIAKMNVNLLSDEQQKILKDVYKQKIRIDKADVEHILSKLKQCKLVNIAERIKNTEFAVKYEITSDDYKEIINSLKVSDYYGNTRDYSLEHFGNNLIIFQKSGMQLSSGAFIEDVNIYIKINLDTTDNTAVAAISFHDIDRLNKLPYTERYNMNLKENSNRYRRVKRALFGDPTGKIKTFAIIAVENPLGWKDSTEEEFKRQYAKWTQVPQKYNKERLDKIKSTEILHKIENNGNTVMKYGGYNYVQIKGKFDNNYEKSFIIFNIPLVDAKAIARGYGQLSFWWGKVSSNENEPSSIGYYETNNACVTYKLVEVSNTIVSMDDADDMFSKYGFKFKINLNYFGDEVKEPSNAKEFEESLEEEHSTFMGRAIHRRRAYKDSNKNKGVIESMSKWKSEVPERMAKHFRDSIEQEDFINLKESMKYIYRFININNSTEFDESDVQNAFEEIDILPDYYDEEVYDDYEEFEDEWNGALRELYDMCDYYRVFIPTITDSNDRYVEERLLKEDEEEEVVLYDDDGSKIVLDKEALEFTDRYRDSTSDMMKDILGFDC